MRVALAVSLATIASSGAVGILFGQQVEAPRVMQPQRVRLVEGSREPGVDVLAAQPLTVKPYDHWQATAFLISVRWTNECRLVLVPVDRVHVTSEKVPCPWSR